MSPRYSVKGKKPLLVSYSNQNAINEANHDTRIQKCEALKASHISKHPI